MNAQPQWFAPVAAPVGEDVLVWGPFRLNHEFITVQAGGCDLSLTPLQFRLMEVFLRRPGRVYSREQLLDQVWGYTAEIDARTIDQHIRRLRTVLAEAGGLDAWLQTCRGFGYALRPPVRRVA